MAITYAKQEIGVGNIDPLIAQERALLSCKLKQLQNQLEKTKVRKYTQYLGGHILRISNSMNSKIFYF